MPEPGNNIYQIKMSLLGAQPPIWRRLLIGPDTTFQDLHRIIQLAMGWYSSHLHLFQADDGRLIGDPAEDFDGMQDFRDETIVTVSAVLNREGQALKYEYDFGDSWEQKVLLEKILPGEQIEPLPRCIKAVRQCPPEFVDLDDINQALAGRAAIFSEAETEITPASDFLGLSPSQVH